MTESQRKHMAEPAPNLKSHSYIGKRILNVRPKVNNKEGGGKGGKNYIRALLTRDMFSLTFHYISNFTHWQFG